MQRIIGSLLLFLAITSSCDKKSELVEPLSDVDFSYTVGSFGAVSFINNSVNAKSYLWEFGDNTTSTQESPSHLYYNTGTYKVKLTAYNNQGKPKSAEKTIFISSKAYKAVIIKEITFVKHPAGNIFYRINDSTGNTVLLDGKNFVKFNSTQNAGLFWPVSPNFKFTDIYSEIGLICYYYSNSTSFTPLTYVKFRFSNFLQANQPAPTLINLKDPSNMVDATLNIDWE